MEASLSKSTWGKHASALNCLLKFELERNVNLSWPLTEKFICDFIAWAANTKGLKSSTIKAYLSTFNLQQRLKGFPSNIFDSATTKMVLRGVENVEFYKELAKPARLVMTLPLLKILGHQIAKSEWSTCDKQTIWTVCTVAFFGSFRLGELLSKNEKTYNRVDTLTWGDLTFRGKSVIIHIRVPKCRQRKGESVEIFRVPNVTCCPVKAISRLRDVKPELRGSHSPVFSMESGTLLTPALMNKCLYKLLSPVLGEKASQLTGHSFRAGIPSALANRPDLASSLDIKSWGRWGSESYEVYARLKPAQKEILFQKIMECLKI